MSNYIWLLDAGHGGMKDGKYTTAPEKMHVFDDGLTFYEGVNNRAIVSKLVNLLVQTDIAFEMVFDAEEDTPLAQRVGKANAIFARDRRCIYLSVHSDAMPDGLHGNGRGFSIYTSKGQTRSDRVANLFCEIYKAELGRFRLRKELSDGDADWESDFYVLRKTNCPALLVENLFFDNRCEAEFLMSQSGQEKIAEVLFHCIEETEKRKPI